MKRNVIITILIILLVAFGLYFYDQNNKRAVAPTEETARTNEVVQPGSQAEQKVPTTTQTTSPSGASAEKKAPAPASQPESQGTWSSGSEAEGMAPDILVLEVSYDGTAFSPSTVNIKIGDIVVFRNKSNKAFWPASGPHPSHTNYPEFDPEDSIAAGGKWQFTFEKVGSWKFHDHLNPSATGTINVEAR